MQLDNARPLTVCLYSASHDGRPRLLLLLVLEFYDCVDFFQFLTSVWCEEKVETNVSVRMNIY